MMAQSMLRLTVLILMWSLATIPGLADVTQTLTDKDGSRDHPQIKRYEGSVIVSYEHKKFDAFTIPLSRLEPVKGKRMKRQQLFAPSEKKTLEGDYTRLVYVVPAGRSPLEVLRNYVAEIQSKGGRVLYECKGAQCGGDPGRSSASLYRDMSLAMYLFPEERITDPRYSMGWCAMTASITDQQYAALEVPETKLNVSVLTYILKDKYNCKALNDRTIAIVDIVEAVAREQKMVTVKAEDMAEKISATGGIALYGIHFDFDKADIKPESEPTLEQIAKLLENDTTLKLLVVGHTDNSGTFEYNQGLSQRRAAAVVHALVTRYHITKDRLTPIGVSYASPVASNKTDEGRAKNRRVELVDN